METNGKNMFSGGSASVLIRVFWKHFDFVPF
jgi:hypothetical protein